MVLCFARLMQSAIDWVLEGCLCLLSSLLCANIKGSTVRCRGNGKFAAKASQEVKMHAVRGGIYSPLFERSKGWYELSDKI